MPQSKWASRRHPWGRSPLPVSSKISTHDAALVWNLRHNNHPGYRPVGDIGRWSQIWMPSPMEFQDCCKGLNSFNMWTLYRHCYTVRHVANLLKVDPLALRREIISLYGKVNDRRSAPKEYEPVKGFKVMHVMRFNDQGRDVVFLSGMNGQKWMEKSVTSYCTTDFSEARRESVIKSHLRSGTCGCGSQFTIPPLHGLWSYDPTSMVITSVQSSGHVAVSNGIGRAHHLEITHIWIPREIRCLNPFNPYEVAQPTDSRPTIDILSQRYGVPITVLEDNVNYNQMFGNTHLIP